MLIAQNFVGLVDTSLNAMSFLTVPLHKIITGKSLTVADHQKFQRKLLISIAFACIMILQLVHAWVKGESVAALIQSSTYTTTMANHLHIAFEHYWRRHELTYLFNAFLEFERRYNRKITSMLLAISLN